MKKILKVLTVSGITALNISFGTDATHPTDQNESVIPEVCSKNRELEDAKAPIDSVFPMSSSHQKIQKHKFSSLTKCSEELSKINSLFLGYFANGSAATHQQISVIMDDLFAVLDSPVMTKFFADYRETAPISPNKVNISYDTFKYLNEKFQKCNIKNKPKLINFLAEIFYAIEQLVAAIDNNE